MGLNFAKLSVLETESLEVLFSEIEMFKASNDLNEDKALGLDGYTVALWQLNWEQLRRKC